MRFFASQGRHVARMGVKFGMEASVPNFTLIDWCNDQGIGVGPPKLKKKLLRFYQNVEHKRHPLRDLHKFCTVCTPLHDALVVKIIAQGVMELWGF